MLLRLACAVRSALRDTSTTHVYGILESLLFLANIDILANTQLQHRLATSMRQIEIRYNTLEQAVIAKIAEQARNVKIAGILYAILYC